MAVGNVVEGGGQRVVEVNDMQQNVCVSPYAFLLSADLIGFLGNQITC